MASQFAANTVVAENADHVFRKQVTGALHYVACRQISNGVNGDTLTWARRVRRDPTTEANRWIWRLLENATFAANPEAADDGAVVTIIEQCLPDMVIQ